MTSRPSAPPGPPTGGADALQRPRRRYSLLTRRDKIVMGLMVGIPTFLCLALIWFPTIFSVGLSFTTGRASRGLEAKNFIGIKNYETLFTAYPPFWPAVWHNILLAAGVPVHRDADRHLPCGAARPGDARDAASTRAPSSSRSCCRWPSSGSSGSCSTRPQGFINSVLGRTRPGQRHRLAGQPEPQHLGRAGRGQLAPRGLHDGPVPGWAEERRPDAA